MMDDVRLCEYALLMPRILPQALPAPPVVVLDALQQVAVDFCRRADVWRTVQESEIRSGASRLELEPDRGTAVSRVLALELAGSRLSPGMDFRSDDGVVAFHTPVRQDCLVRIVAAIRPTRFATRIPEPILEEWGDYLAAGTLARVLSQSGPQVGWSNPDGSTLHFSLYEEGVAKARIRAVRGLDSFITYPSIRVREAI